MTAYAFRNNDEQLLRSSSGGAFIALCQMFERKYGLGKVAFFGVTFDEQMQVVHKSVDSFKECQVFQGSKYVKSNIKGIFKQVGEKLNKGINVLFSGVPCQIFGLKKYLCSHNIPDDKLLTIDLICHGSPKVQVWIDYVKWLEKKNGAKLVDYSFRYKPEGWKAYPAYAKFENGKTLVNTCDTSIYSELHMHGYSIASGCFKCQFSSEERCGDITLGDFWNADELAPNLYSSKGVSLILSNTHKADEILELLCENNMGELLKIQGNRYLECQHNLKKPTDKPADCEEFWEYYNVHSFEQVLEKYIGYGKKYALIFSIKKFMRKTPFIEIYRKVREKSRNR